MEVDFCKMLVACQANFCQYLCSQRKHCACKDHLIPLIHCISGSGGNRRVGTLEGRAFPCVRYTGMHGQVAGVPFSTFFG